MTKSALKLESGNQEIRKKQNKTFSMVSRIMPCTADPRNAAGHETKVEPRFFSFRDFLISRFIIFSLLFLAGFGLGRARADEIPPPFGLQWGESDERLSKLLDGAKARVVDKHMVADREAWTVEGLLQTGLKRTVFYFKNHALVEVELQYQGPDWDTTKYDDFMTAVRRRIEQKYGAGQLIAREKTPQGDITQTVIGYKWNQNNTAIELIYYCAENGSNTWRTVSVHYKGY